MNEMLTRRNLMVSAAVLGASATVAAVTAAMVSTQHREKTDAEIGAEFENSEQVRRGIEKAAAVAGACTWSEDEVAERSRVTGIGFTDDEATTWLLLNRAIATWLTLPALHPADRAELTLVFHDLQTRLMARPTYGRYRRTFESP